jgi:hypothetical protein
VTAAALYLVIAMLRLFGLLCVNFCCCDILIDDEDEKENTEPEEMKYL